jgi:hypothetical protein
VDSPVAHDAENPTMPRTMTLNVRVSGALGEFVAANVGEDGI